MEHTSLLFLIQGLTEFLPVSSSAHLLFFALPGGASAFSTFDLALMHLLPGLLLLVFFCEKALPLLCDLCAFCAHPVRCWHQKEGKMAFFFAFVAAVIPALFCGAALTMLHIDLHGLATRSLIAWNAIIFGGLMLLADLLGAQRAKQSWRIRYGVIFGIWQLLAFVPGVSRLGISLTAMRFLGFSRDASVRFSFLTGLPILLGAGALGVLTGAPFQPAVIPWKGIFLMVGAGALVLPLFCRFFSRFGAWAFAFYRVGLGVWLLVKG